MVIIKQENSEKCKKLKEISARVIRESGLEAEVNFSNDQLSQYVLGILQNGNTHNRINVVVQDNYVNVSDPKLYPLALRLAEAFEEVYGKDSFTLEREYIAISTEKEEYEGGEW